MEPQVSASFIPRKPLVAGPSTRSAAGSLFFVLALLLFIASLVLGGGVFAYGQYLSSALASKTDSLGKARQAYDPSVIESLIRLDARIRGARALMHSHIAPSSIFTFLENVTLQNVNYTSFDYGSQGGRTVSLTLAGVAPDFGTVALQSDAFGTSRVLKDVLFSDINVSDTGRVIFKVQGVMDPSFLLYTNALEARSAEGESLNPNATIPPATPASSTMPPQDTSL